MIIYLVLSHTFINRSPTFHIKNKNLDQKCSSAQIIMAVNLTKDSDTDILDNHITSMKILVHRCTDCKIVSIFIIQKCDFVLD